MSKARKKFTRLILMAVSAIGVLSTLLLLTDPPPPDLDNGSDLFSLNSASLTPQRNVASTEGAAKDDALMEINCTDIKQLIETSSPRFRMKGHACVPSDVNVLTTQVQNKTNGYVATVFHQSSLFTTDYISLKEGQNDIDVKFDTENGSVEKIVTVFRNGPVRR